MTLWYIFPRFGMFYIEKSGSPAARAYVMAGESQISSSKQKPFAFKLSKSAKKISKKN
jgi:hypothetical protein